MEAAADLVPVKLRLYNRRNWKGSPAVPDANENLWAPWRMEYIRSLGEEMGEDGCFLCSYWRHPENDGRNRVLWRSALAFAVMNRFPYTNGHLLIAHGEHRADFNGLGDEELAEINRLIREATGLLRLTVKAEGFNIGYNLGRCAGAGLPDHLHLHIVPRWAGDTNFMAVIGDCRVIPDSLDALYRDLLENLDAAGVQRQRAS